MRGIYWFSTLHQTLRSWSLENFALFHCMHFWWFRESWYLWDPTANLADHRSKSLKYFLLASTQCSRQTSWRSGMCIDKRWAAGGFFQVHLHLTIASHFCKAGGQQKRLYTYFRRLASHFSSIPGKIGVFCRTTCSDMEFSSFLPCSVSSPLEVVSHDKKSEQLDGEIDFNSEEFLDIWFLFEPAVVFPRPRHLTCISTDTLTHLNQSTFLSDDDSKFKNTDVLFSAFWGYRLS